MDDTETITIYSDYVCPFCYLGRRALEDYRSSRTEPLEIEWRPFDLRADKRGPDGEIDQSVDDGKDEAYYDRARENVRRLQERYGVEMAQEIATEVDSLRAQIVSYHLAERRSHEEWLAFDEAVFEALWLEGRDIGDVEVLVDVADDVGIDPDVVRTALEEPDVRAAVRNAFAAAREAGVTGVPTFVYGDHVARGAVPPAQLRRLVE